MARKLAETRIPTEFGTFALHLYRNGSNEDHVAFVLGGVSERDDVLTRVHSECFTGEILGSLRCDCSAQLRLALRRIAQEGSGVLIYLRQEGRGIGLLDKLRAYNLQDLGHDTVDANLLLGHESDERTYDLAALMLRDLNVRSVRLLTNNPSKVQGLRHLGVSVTAREPLVASAHLESAQYLQTKVHRMGHQIDLAETHGTNGASHHGSAMIQPHPVSEIATRVSGFRKRSGRPFVTLCYAQSLDGCLSATQGKPLALSGTETLTLTHRLRAAHDAVMIGIGTVLSDNPRLTVRHVAGRNPQPIVLDSKLRIPLDCSLLGDRRRCVWLATVEGCAPQRRQAVEAAGAQNSVFPCHRRRPRGSREYPLAFLRKGYRLRDGGGRGESNQEPAGRKASRLPCDHHSPSLCRRRARGASADRAIDGPTHGEFSPREDRRRPGALG